MPQNDDPVDHSWAPLLQWAREVRLASAPDHLRPPSVHPLRGAVRLFTDEYKVIGPRRPRASRVNGPASAIHFMLREADWTYVGPWGFVTDAGNTLNMTKVAPPELRAQV